MEQNLVLSSQLWTMLSQNLDSFIQDMYDLTISFNEQPFNDITDLMKQEYSDLDTMGKDFIFGDSTSSYKEGSL